MGSLPYEWNQYPKMLQLEALQASTEGSLLPFVSGENEKWHHHDHLWLYLSNRDVSSFCHAALAVFVVRVTSGKMLPLLTLAVPFSQYTRMKCWTGSQVTIMSLTQRPSTPLLSELLNWAGLTRLRGVKWNESDSMCQWAQWIFCRFLCSVCVVLIKILCRFYEFYAFLRRFVK